jgi:hypothetical protein
VKRGHNHAGQNRLHCMSPWAESPMRAIALCSREINPSSRNWRTYGADWTLPDEKITWQFLVITQIDGRAGD